MHDPVEVDGPGQHRLDRGGWEWIGMNKLAAITAVLCAIFSASISARAAPAPDPRAVSKEFNTIPPFYGARERWSCAFVGHGTPAGLVTQEYV